jgi:hypothetical protein
MRTESGHNRPYRAFPSLLFAGREAYIRVIISQGILS